MDTANEMGMCPHEMDAAQCYYCNGHAKRDRQQAEADAAEDDAWGVTRVVGSWRE